MSERNRDAGDRSRSDRRETLYERALALDPDARDRFLAEACSDPGLREELSSLLAHREPAEAFFAGLAKAIVAPAVGHRVAQYRLVGILGHGGMGTVYRAHDTRLDREVALKFLPMYQGAQPEARERFLVEARAAAALEHPNVCSIHEIGETSEGWPFIAMACYEGETLQARLSRGPLPPAEALDIATQLAHGLDAAHTHGIVHRDVKPGNIMLCADGTVRLLDFGLAKVSDVSITGPGATPGTVAYMSPEHARGDPVGPGTDLWSLGVVLYEMLSGVRPFRGGNDRALVQAILHEDPEPLQSRTHDAPAFLSRIVEQLLRKDPTERYRSAEELLGDLTRGAHSGGFEVLRHWMRAHNRFVALGVSALLVGFTVLAVARPTTRPGAATPPAEIIARPPAIAVLPFAVHGPDLELWREGMVDLLAMGLDGAAGMRTIDSRTLLARWHQTFGDAPAAELGHALDVARAAGARYALIGSVVAAGPLIRLRADVYDVASGSAVGPVQMEGPRDSILALVDQLGIQTLGLVLEKSPGEVPALDLAGITTTSLIALRSYLEGEALYRRADFRGASAAWARAVRADSLFALAHYNRAEVYGWDGGDLGAYWENLQRANRLADRLPELERMVLGARTARLTGTGDAITTLREIIRKYPDAAAGWYELGEAYFHDANAMGTAGEAEAAFRMAAKLQPTMAPYAAHLLELVFRWYPDSGYIARELESHGRMAPEGERTRAGRIAHALAFGDSGARAGARADLAGVNSEIASSVYLLMSHPRLADAREAAFPAIDSRLDQRTRSLLRHRRTLNLGLMDGRVRVALRILDDSAVRDGIWYCGPAYLADRGMPVPETIMEQRYAASLADSALFSTPHPVMCAAQLAARLGDWTRHEALLARARAVAAREQGAGNRLGAIQWNRAVLSAEAHGLWRQGRTEAALDAFERSLTGGAWRSLWHVGELSLEVGQLDRAERAFRALLGRDGTPAYLQLARILEQTGRPAEAREAYEFVADAWRGADPELRPIAEKAHTEGMRLSRAGH